MAALIILLALGLIVGTIVLSCMSWCRIFRKVGLNPGKFFIPVYGNYLAYDIADCRGIFITQMVISGIVSVISNIADMASMSTSSYYYTSYSYSSYSDSALSGLLAMFAFMMVGMMIFQIIFSVRLARNFGKGGGFACGLVFLFPVFLAILAFGDAVYCGERYYHLQKDFLTAC